MKVELIDYTRDALRLLLLTKNTRLAFDEDPGSWPMARQLSELAYMRDTIKSSYEFVAFTFRIEDVSRALTHQLVRTRAGSYAQESQRTVDARDNGFLDVEFDEGINAQINHDLYHALMTHSFRGYAELVNHGVPPQDARNVLPTGTLTSIIAKFNLRTLHEMGQVRLCVRTQGELQSVFREMKARVVEVYPWTEPFIRVGCALDGICRFPRYDKCPISPLTYNGVGSVAASTHKTRCDSIQERAESVRHEARPVAKGGRTM